MGLDPQESFAKMDKNGDMQNGVRGQVMHLNPPMMQKTSEEIWNGKAEASKNMGVKNNRFIHPFMRKGFTIRSPPMDNVSGLKKMLFYKTKQMKIGTLTRHLRQLRPPSPSQQSSWAPWERGEDDPLLLHAWGLAVASFSRHSEARVDELDAGEQIETESVLNLDLLEEVK